MRRIYLPRLGSGRGVALLAGERQHGFRRLGGAWSDTFSRKWPLVAGHGFLAAGMVLTGLVTAYPLILCTQVLWGLGWAFSGGADVAWLTDELAQPGRIARVLAARSIVGGLALLVAAKTAGMSATFIASGALIACVGALIAILRVRVRSVDTPCVN